MRDTLLIIHIVAAAVWLGGSVMASVINAKVGRSESPEASARLARAQTDLSVQFYMPAAVITLLSGIGLVLVSDGVYGFGDPFVSFGFLVIIIAAILGPVKFKPLTERIADGFETGDTAGALAAVGEIRRWSALTTALLLIAFALMVLKTGA